MASKNENRSLHYSGLILLGMVIILLVYFLSQRSHYTNNALFEEYYSVPVPKEAKDNEAVPPAFANGIIKYYDTSYVEAIQYLGRVQRASDRYWEAFDFIADCYYRIDQTDQTLRVYEKMSREADTRHREIAEWKRSLFLIHENADQGDILDQLGEILDQTDHTYFEEAGDLYLKVKSPIRLFVPN